MKRWISAILLCLAASTLGVSIGATQEASPAADPSVPEGAIGVDSRVFFKDGLGDIDAVEFILMTDWEMDSPEAAERFFDTLAASVSANVTVRTSSAQLQPLNDEQLLIAGEDEFGGPVTIVLFRQGTHLGTWMAVGDVGQDHLLADLYNDFFATGYDPGTPFPGEADLPKGYSQAGT